jgi:predicted CXXCH cytochrome family protein
MPGRKTAVIPAVCIGLLLLATYLPAKQPQQAEDPMQGATPVGWDTCAECHQDIAQGFERTIHGRTASFEQYGQAPGCESCHGPGSLHADSGDPALIRTFSDLGSEESSAACLGCHEPGVAMEWAGSIHDNAGVACSDCHSIHQAQDLLTASIPVDRAVPRVNNLSPHTDTTGPRGLLAAPEAEMCLDCHPDQRAAFNYSSHHPVVEGRMTCSSCHLEDGAIHGNTAVENTVNERCLVCHEALEGPHIFEHAPVEEDCLICHSPHGAVADNLLQQNEPFICLQCHEQHFHATRAGATTPYYLPSGGSDNPFGREGFMRAFNTRCTPCHQMVHGSDLPSLSVPGQGKKLIR